LAGVQSPAAIAKDRVVDCLYGPEEAISFVLSHGQPGAIGGEIARVSFDGKVRPQYDLFNGMLYCLRATRLQAFVGTIKEDPKPPGWRPWWTVDILAELPEQERVDSEYLPGYLRVNADGVWVAHGPWITQLIAEGLIRARYKLKKFGITRFDLDTGTPLVFGRGLIYCTSSQEVIALDWQNRREALEVLDRWNNPEDTALLRKYTRHPCPWLGEYVKGMLEKRR
jgi:hypothetical protein